MAITAKVTFIFNFQKQGWSETWFAPASDTREALATARVVAQARANLLGRDGRIEAVKVSDVLIPADNRTSFQPAIFPNRPVAANIGWLTDQAPTSVLVRASSSELYRRQLWLRGMVDDWVRWSVDLKRMIWTQEFNNYFGPYRDALINNRYCIRALSRVGGIAPLRQIGAITTSLSGRYAITAQAHLAANVDKVRITGVKGTNVEQVNGLWQVFNVTANTFEIPLSVPAGVTLLYKGGGKVRKRVNGYFEVDRLEPQRIGTRKVGRAFFVPAGRRSARA